MKKLLILTAFIACSSFTAAAQMTTINTPLTIYNQGIVGVDPVATSIMNNMMSNRMNQQIAFDSMNRRMAEKRVREDQRKQGTSSSSPGNGTYDRTPVSTKFRERKGSIILELAEAKSLDPNVLKIAKECLEGYRLYADTKKLPTNDVATALQYFAIVNYIVYNDLYYKNLNKPENRSGENVYKQLKEELSQAESLRKLTDRQKQIFAEGLALRTSAPFMTYIIGNEEKKPDLVKKAREIAKANLAELFGNPDDLKITENGIELK